MVGDRLLDGISDLKEAKELEKYMKISDEIYQHTKEFQNKIIAFETAIGRPYFSDRPLDDTVVGNWKNYLEFIEKEGNEDKVCMCFLCLKLANIFSILVGMIMNSP